MWEGNQVIVVSQKSSAEYVSKEQNECKNVKTFYVIGL